MAKLITLVGCSTCPYVRPEGKLELSTELHCSKCSSRNIGHAADFALRTPEWCPLQDMTLTHTDRDVDAAQCIWGHMMECYEIARSTARGRVVPQHVDFMDCLLGGGFAFIREECRSKEMLRNLWAVHARIEMLGIKTDFERDFIPWFWEHCLVWEPEPVERFMSFRTDWEEQSLHKLKRGG